MPSIPELKELIQNSHLKDISDKHNEDEAPTSSVSNSLQTKESHDNKNELPPMSSILSLILTS